MKRPLRGNPPAPVRLRSGQALPYLWRRSGQTSLRARITLPTILSMRRKTDPLKQVRALRKQRTTLKRALASVDAKLRKQQKDHSTAARSTRRPAAKSPRKRASLRKKRSNERATPKVNRIEIKLPSLEIQAGLELRRTTASATAAASDHDLPLKVRIHEALKAAGPNGVSLQDLAAQLGVNYKHVSAWFATTGTKLPTIQKVGATTYRFALP